MGKDKKSAFRAVNDVANQPVTADNQVKVLFPTEQFDLKDEYNPATSTFIPDKDGVYLIIASAQFSPGNTDPYRVRIVIRVNSTDVARDNDFFSTLNIDNDVAVTTIVELEENDKVEVFLDSTLAGEIVSDSATTRFEAARLVSSDVSSSS
ncbi:hypothetical protein [Peribacillus simplex]|uniref:hypothetical protein n=1 Tax=Peribacillus simplex TaxID=1478 RepID=UPI003672BB9C